MDLHLDRNQVLSRDNTAVNNRNGQEVKEMKAHREYNIQFTFLYLFIKTSFDSMIIFLEP